MTRKETICLWIFLLAVLSSCGRRDNPHFIADETLREQTGRDFAAKRAFFADTQLFLGDTVRSAGELFEPVFAGLIGQQPPTQLEIEALTFLYAYMPSSDMATYMPEFFLDQIRAAFEARRSFPWGRKVPDGLFRHFVLPSRVNNEDMDTCRRVFMRELMPRLKGLSMGDAALEVNHWCHEQVVYAPTDQRTSGPLAVVARAYGRCGEESVFTVAALRAVGIPARQVYTPRWAHTDDNHAWVEVWIDGRWHYMGACEPEPQLDMAWFSSSVRRAMAANTWVFGRYDGPEEILDRNECYTLINVLPAYAQAKQAVVVVSDEAGNVVEGVPVEFGLYNYAEFYPIAVKTTDVRGRASLTTGYGTLVVAASRGDSTAIASFNVARSDTLRLTLAAGRDTATISYRLVPPPESRAALRAPDPEEHLSRLRCEDSIRTSRIASFRFADRGRAVELAAGLGLDTARTVPLLMESLSNGPVIEKFLRTTPVEHRKLAFDLLETLSPKDLQEISLESLYDHLGGVVRLEGRYKDTPLHRDYVLQPRVANELITPWRVVMRRAMLTAGTGEADILAKVRSHLATIKEVGGYNPRGFAQSPVATIACQYADPHSRAIFGVAMLRSVGVPARIDPVTGCFEAFVSGRWQPVYADGNESAAPAAGRLAVRYSGGEGVVTPKYEYNYTIGRWRDGAYHTLGLDNGRGDLAGTATSREKVFEVPPGDYRIISGRRLWDGSVLARVAHYSVAGGKTTGAELHFDDASHELAMIGSMNPEAQYMPHNGKGPVSVLQTTGRGFFVLLVIDAAKEPSRHLIEELTANSSAIDHSRLPIVCLLRDEASLQAFIRSGFKGLPANMNYGYDRDGAVLRELSVLNERPDFESDLPLVMVADSFGRVFFISSGYRIGLGEAISEVCRTVTATNKQV